MATSSPITDDTLPFLKALDWPVFTNIQKASIDRKKIDNSIVAKPLILKWLTELLSGDKKDAIVRRLLKNIALAPAPYSHRTFITSYYSTMYHTDTAKNSPYEDCYGEIWTTLHEYITNMKYHTTLTITSDTELTKPAWWIYNHTDFRQHLLAAFDKNFFSVRRNSTEWVTEKDLFTTTKYDIYVEFWPNSVPTAYRCT